MNRIKKEIEHADAPSGYVTLYNYKEPFMSYKGGFGYEGVLLFDGDTDKVQCHFCGSWYDYLPSHIKIHGLNAKEYKIEVGLRNSTALISETHREKLIANRSVSIKNLKKCKVVSEETRRKISRTVKKNRKIREYQNEKGTCPYQILDRINKKVLELGRVPTKAEFGGYTTAVRLYGTWRNAVKLAGHKPRKVGINVLGKRGKYPRHIIEDFIKIYGRKPTPSDYRRRLIPLSQV